MTKYVVKCKKKHAVEGRIEYIRCINHVTGEESRFDEDEAIKRIEAGVARFVVRDDSGHEAVVEVEEREGRKYLITRRDSVKTDNLLALPECSSKPVVVPPPHRPVKPARSHCVRTGWEGLGQW
jgi:hypothetical protein